jgi:hypothetical protein
MSEAASAFFSRGTGNSIVIGVLGLLPTSQVLGVQNYGAVVANLVGKRPAEYASDPNYTVTGGSTDRFVTVIDNRTGFVEAFFDRHPRLGGVPLPQLPNEKLPSDGLAYQQRQTFYKYLGANGY